MSSTSATTPDQRRPWALFASALALTLCASSGLFYLLVGVIPHHAVAIEQLGQELPYSTRLAFRAANWFMRLLPLLTVAAVLATPIATVLLALTTVRVGLPRVLRALAIAISTVGVAEVVGCLFILYAIGPALATAAR